MKSISTKIICFLLLSTFFLSPVAAAPLQPAPEVQETVVTEEDQAWLDLAATAESFTVQLQAPSLVMYLNEKAALSADGELAAADLPLDSDEAIAYLAQINAGLDSFIAQAETLLGRPLEVDYRYDYVLNGFSAKMSLEEAALLREQPEVKEVFANTVYRLDSDTSPSFVGADKIWDSTNIPLPAGKQGEGIRVGIIDTGINVSHPSFSQSAFGYSYPAPPEGFLGLCLTSPAGHQCNNKLIGIYDLLYNANGHDQVNHGSHVAGIAAGNKTIAYYKGMALPVSGIAPRAQIISYKTCDIQGCPTEAVVAGINRAVADRVSVITIGASPQSGPPRNPWQDPTNLASLEAMSRGVVVSTSAGNFGSTPATVYQAVPWSLVTGNSTHGRVFGYDFYAVGYGIEIATVAVPASTDLAPRLAVAITQKAIIRAASNDLYGCNAWTNFPPNGGVALVKRGVCDFKTKLQNAKTAGATFVMVYNDVPGVPPIEMGSTSGSVDIPAAMVSFETGDRIMNHNIELIRADIPVKLIGGSEPQWQDVLAESSSRGPISNLDLLKPDLVAPGLNILAAYAAPNSFDLMSGSTMASAQVAGAAVLMKSLFPSWSPSAIQSALIMTALAGATRDFDGTAVDAFDYGNGRLDLTKAALTGLVMEESVGAFYQANPSRGGDPRNLNIPSYQNGLCLGSCTFSRTVRNVSGVATSYTVSTQKWNAMQVTTSPSGTFTIPAGGTQRITITVKPTLDAGEPWQFAKILLKTTNTFPNGKKISDVGFSLAVKTKLNGSNLPSEVRQFTGLGTNRITLQNLMFTGPITSFNTTRYGLTPATSFGFSIAQDPSRSLPYDDLSQVWYTTTTCPSNQQRMVVEVLKTQASDLDVYIGTGTTPSKATEVIASAQVGALEYINIINPTFSGQCWIMVQSYASSSPGASDSTQLAVGFVPKTVHGTFNVTGPATLPALTPFEMKVDYGLVDFNSDKWVWYGYLMVGSATGKTDDIGSVSINLYKVVLDKDIYLPMIRK